MFIATLFKKIAIVYIFNNENIYDKLLYSHCNKAFLAETQESD